MSSVPHVTTHRMKATPEDWVAIHTGLKTFEVTILLENMKVGDHVVFKEFAGGVYHPDRSTMKQITYIQHLTGNLCVIALNNLDEYHF